MRSFSEYNPVVIAAVVFSVTGVAMFCNYPVFTAITLIGGVACYATVNGRKGLRPHLWLLAAFIVLSLVNPLISHNGRTVLFVLNHGPVTLEALLYGVNSAGMIVGALYWFSSFTHIMTSEKLLYLTGAMSPKLSLVLSMTMRAVPLFRDQWKKVSDAQKAAGLFAEDNIIDDIRGNMRIFSIMTTWAIENGIITADSMEARGYGVGRRSHFTAFRFTATDILLLITSLVLLSITAFTAPTLEFAFYPDTFISAPSAAGASGIAAYAVLAMLPVIIETEATLKWKYLQSRL